VDYATLGTTFGVVDFGIETIRTIDGGVWTALAAGPVLDTLDSMNAITPAEVTLTTSVSDARHLFYTHTEAFYVQKSDLPNYWTKQRPDGPQLMPTEQLGLYTIPVRGN
jgi:hypothetical protein